MGRGLGRGRRAFIARRGWSNTGHSYSSQDLNSLGGGYLAEDGRRNGRKSHKRGGLTSLVGDRALNRAQGG